ncbi:MAG: transglycosylase domain-containing protein, partial [Clostridiales bacterium]|nr:transglycosylase domain-containing protein [Clostridiales bacterium]
MEHNRDNKRSKQTRRNRKKHGRAFKVIMTIVLIFVITTAMLVCMAAAYIKNVIIPQADLQLDTFDASMSLTSTMYCRNPSTNNYEAMQTLYGDENRVWVTLDEIPQDLIDAAVAIEDKRFYQHNGVDWRRTINGVLLMFTGRDIQGGSTLTQQLIKNLTTEDDVTVKRKITEIFRALELEQNYTKDQILTWYLNYIYLGEGCNGVYTASYKYFGKHVSQLSLAECASLIGITNNPSKYDPLGRLEIVDEETGEVTTSRDFNKQRQETILYAMLDQGYITQEEYDEAVAEELNFDQGRDLENNTTYTWYEDAVIDDVINDLMETYNWSEEMATQMVFSGGLEIYTCMNPDVQAAVDEIYNDQANLNFTSSAGQQLQSAITVVDNETGEVVAMAGGMGKKTTSRGWNRATDTKRPPGSSIKPLSVYAPALELGVITPSSTYEDSPYQVIDGKNWPVNATGQYQGTVSIAKAVRESINTVAVKVLADVTPQTSYEFMRDRFHIKLVEKRTIKDKEYTDIDLAPLALGGLTDGVSTYDMAAAYSVFPRQGVYKEPRTYSIVIDRNKQILLDNTQEVDESA